MQISAVFHDHFTELLEALQNQQQQLKILKSVNDEVSGFRIMKQFFEAHLASLRARQDQVDLVFEFQAYMTNQIIEAQKRVSAHNGFTFMGDSGTIANEAGHIANLSNQLRAVLFDIRTMALAYQSDAGVWQLRKCPHCGEIWAKIAGCDGSTTCGHRMMAPESRFTTMSTFNFHFDGKKLTISKTGSKVIQDNAAACGKGKVCGQRITWSQMAPVPVPEEFRVTPASVNTEDIAVLPQRNKRCFDQAYSSVEASMGSIKRIRAGAK